MTVHTALRMRRCRIGEVGLDAYTLSETLDAIAALVAEGRGGAVYTPNVDHVVLADTHLPFREAYRGASVVVVDGKPLLWAARLLGTPLPEKVSGSDLLFPLMRLAARRGWRVYILGGAPGVADTAAARFRLGEGVTIVGVDSPAVSDDGACADEAAVLARLQGARPDLVVVAFGTPKQELWIARVRPILGAAVAIGVGATLDFVTGRARRAPRWLSDAGLEWLYRLAHEPRRLWRRYLVRDPRFVATMVRTVRVARKARRPPGAAREA